MDKKIIVLCVDDELLNLRKLSLYLETDGYEVWTVSDGNSALEKIRATPPDIILLDILMPGMSGYEVLLKLRGENSSRRIPVIMLTQIIEANYRIRALEAGCDDFISKPLDRGEVLARVKTILKVKAFEDHLRNHRNELEKEVEKKTGELKQASLETIYRLSKAAEFRDEDTGQHIKRMSNYAALLAGKIGLKDKSAEAILYAAPMHDIGKIGIPDRILLKPGKLNDEEWTIMKKHSEIGARILEGSDMETLKLGKIIALTHHEKWDGTGYPSGLKGKDIPIAGRVSAVADVFDALTSKRPYKDPFPLEKAYAIIREGSEKAFDPVIVKAFFSVQEELLEIREKFKDDGKSHLFHVGLQQK